MPDAPKRPHNYGDLARSKSRFGRLRVKEDTGVRIGNGHVVWLCLCRCGGTALATTANLRSGNTTSCGCFQSERSSEANTYAPGED